MKRTPIKRTRTKPRRTTSPRCATQRCTKRAEVDGQCIKHATIRADRLFSRWVRDRDARCMAVGILDHTCKGPLQAAHLIGRTCMTTRWLPENVWSLCAASHYEIDQHGREGLKTILAHALIGAEWEQLCDMSRYPTDRRVAIRRALEWLEARHD